MIRLRCDRRIHAELVAPDHDHRSAGPIIDRMCRDCSRAISDDDLRYEVHHRWSAISGRRLKDQRYRITRVLESE